MYFQRIILQEYVKHRDEIKINYPHGSEDAIYNVSEFYHLNFKAHFFYQFSLSLSLTNYLNSFMYSKIFMGHEDIVTYADFSLNQIFIKKKKKSKRERKANFSPF